MTRSFGILSSGILLAAGRSGKKDDRGERKCAESEATTGRKHNTRACKKACTRKATAGRKNNTHMRGRPNVSRVRVLVMYCNG
jgi:hypothetical protein